MATAIDKKKPVHSLGPFYSAGSRIECAIWANDGEKDGKTFTTYAVSINRSYNTEGKWKNTSSMRAADIPVAKYALEKAYDWIMSAAKDEVPDDGEF